MCLNSCQIYSTRLTLLQLIFSPRSQIVQKNGRGLTQSVRGRKISRAIGYSAPPLMSSYAYASLLISHLCDKDRQFIGLLYRRF